MELTQILEVALCKGYFFLDLDSTRTISHLAQILWKKIIDFQTEIVSAMKKEGKSTTLVPYVKMAQAEDATHYTDRSYYTYFT